VGCETPPPAPAEPQLLIVDANATIGSLAEFFTAGDTRVEGFGLVGGLHGTGSTECPPVVRDYLRQYILKRLPRNAVNVDEFIASRDTAVVVVQGVMPAMPVKGQVFDLEVVALTGTQTTSLDNGWLYGAELKPVGTFGITVKALAEAQGPVYIDKLGTTEADKRSGHILAGGTVLDDYKIYATLRSPDYRVANIIRNRVNERFGNNVAKAVSAGQIELVVPPAYKNQQQRFVSIIRATHLNETPEIVQRRIIAAVANLAASADKYQSEIALEAIGNKSLGKLSALLNSSNQEVRFRAARCMLNMGSDQGLETLRGITTDKESPYRVEALEAITVGASRRDAAAAARVLVRDEPDLNIRLAAYEQLRKLKDVTLNSEFIARSFYLERLVQTSHRGVFAARSGEPRVVLFGSPIRCRQDVFVQSDDGSITINAAQGQGFVSIIRKHPRRPDIAPINIKSSYDLADIIESLCEESVKLREQGRAGLSVPYSDMIALLKKMSEKGAIDAPFWAGSMPKTTANIK
jgi:flagellar P-ring protein precursor FlgI